MRIHQFGRDNERFDDVDALRGLASLAVAWFHLTNTYTQESAVRSSGAYGWLGVEVFFVLSGFIIPYSMRSWTAWSNHSFAAFIFRRTTRIEIPYAISIFAAVALTYASATFYDDFKGDPFVIPLWSIALNLTYLAPFFDEGWIQPVYWTLAYEFAFYIVCGLLFVRCIDKKEKNNFSYPLLVVASCTLVSLSVLPGYWLLFAMGIATYRKVFCGRSLAETVALIFICGVGMKVTDLGLQAAVGASVSILLLCSRKFQFSGKLGFFLAFLGSISYSLYLTHVIVGGRIINFGQRHITTGFTQEALLSFSALLVSICFAWFFFRFVERPAQLLSKKINLQLAVRNL